MRDLFVISELFVTTGFGGIATNVLPKMKDVRMTALALNCREMGEIRGAFQNGILAYPANPDNDGDWMGFKRLPSIVDRIRPHTIWASNDVSPIHRWWQQIKSVLGKEPPCYMVAYIAIDGEILHPKLYVDLLEDGVQIVTYTHYGIEMLQKALHRSGHDPAKYDKQLSYVPLAIDSSVFRPADRAKTRDALNKALGRDLLKPDSFVVNITNRNAPRKMIALSVWAAAEFAARHGDVTVIVRSGVNDWAGDYTYMVDYAGCSREKFVLAWPQFGGGRGVTTEALAMCYQASDVYLSNSISEGHGLCEHEAAACGCAMILPDNTVRPELWGNVARLMPCSAEILIPPVCQTIGTVPSKATIVDELENAYANREHLKAEGEACSRRAISLSSWEKVAAHMEDRLWKENP